MYLIKMQTGTITHLVSKKEKKKKESHKNKNKTQKNLIGVHVSTCLDPRVKCQ